jgi:aminocarboxymuconate-semialdehyde decarboxylase
MTHHVFGCGPARSANGEVRTTKVAHRSGDIVIDLHCHVHVHSADQLLQDGRHEQGEPMLAFASSATQEINKTQMRTVNSKLTLIHERLQDMDRLGIDVQTLSPSPFQFCYWAEPERGLEAARLVNNGIAEMVASTPGRFVGLATVPMQAPSLAAIELERAVRELGLRGAEIATSVQGEELSDKRFRPLFSKAEELGALIFLHPNGFSDGRRLADHYFINTIGNPLDSAIAISHLIFDGVLADLPKLKLCVAHGGGYLPAYAGRMDHAYAARADCRRCIQEPPSSYLKRLYFDTVVFNPAQLDYLVGQYGADHLVLGTDYPFDMAEPDPVGFVSRLASLTAKERSAILGGNAARLLGLDL